ncbi:MAG: oligosaccharide flippase family protein [Lachnospiraceae bacterium]|nr:oligosaccharide flippase family protein [Lachnospiraceae bacterium]
MKNMIYIYACTLLIAIMNFVVRRIFLDVLTIDYLGYDGLFTSIFSYLNLSEMGIASIITYHMYTEIASDNTLQIRKLLCIYKVIYRVVGLFVLCAGLIVSIFLPVILAKQNLTESWQFIYTIYYMQLAATLCTYFLAYRRILFITHERIYVCTSVDTVINIISVIVKMIILLKLRNYIAYLAVSIMTNIATNLIISVYSHKEYPEITRTAVTRDDIRALNLWHEVKNMMATKIATTIYGASDDIIITVILGLTTNGIVSNYRMISSKILEFIISAFNSLQASIGSLINDRESEMGIPFFKALDLSGFFLALVSASGVMCVSQEFILLWLKKPDYLLPYAFVVLLSLNLFIAIQNNPMNYFRNTLGHFETDRNFMIAAAAVNVILSIILSIRFGITGIMVGTVIGHLLIYMGRCVVVFKYFIKESPVRYYLTVLFRMLLLILSVTCTMVIGNVLKPHITSPLAFLLIKGIISVAVSVLIFTVSYCRSDSFKTILHYATIVKDMIKHKK